MLDGFGRFFYITSNWMFYHHLCGESFLFFFFFFFFFVFHSLNKITNLNKNESVIFVCFFSCFRKKLILGSFFHRVFFLGLS